MSTIRTLGFSLVHCAAIVALSGGYVHALHLDIVPYFEPDGAGYQFSAGRFDFNKTSQGADGTLPPAPIERNVLAFFGSWHERGDGAVVNGDPGWNLPYDAAHFDGFGAEYPGGTLPPQSGRLKFNVVSDPRLGRNLSYWDGTGAPSFGPVPSGEIVDIYKPGFPQAESVTLDGTNTSLPGLELTSRLSTGFHAHTGHYLFGDETRSLAPEDQPTPGFYLYSLNMEIENATLFPNYPSFTPAITGIHAVTPTFHVILAHGFASAGENYIYGDPLFEELWAPLFDDNGDPVLDESGYPAYGPVLDEDGNPVLIPILDDQDNPFLEILGTDGYFIAPEMQLAVDWVHANLGAVPEPGAMSLSLAVVPFFIGLVRRRAASR